MKNNAIVCRKCGLISKPKIEKVSLPSGGFHQKAVCIGCNKFLKFLPHGVPTLYFGKYKGSTIAEVAKTDPNYLKWLSDKDVKPASLLMAIRGALCKQP